MNKDQFKGKVDNLKGRGKEAVGAVTGNKETEAEGVVERAAGAVREKVGDVKEKLTGDGKRDRSVSHTDPDEDIE